MRGSIKEKFKPLFLLLCTMFFSVMLGLACSANPDGPKITSPVQYAELPIGYHTFALCWEPPSSSYGTVSYYVISIREFHFEDKMSNGTLERVEVNNLIVDRDIVSDGVRSYVVPGSNLYPNRKYRYSICGVTTTGRNLWSDEGYFYSSAHAGIKPPSLSLKIWEGFPLATKDAIYYSSRSWNNVLNIEGGIVNTCPYNISVDSSVGVVRDGNNAVIPSANLRRGIVMQTNYWVENTTGLLYEADIEINSTLPWSTTGAAGYYDVQNVMTHEIGHCIGLTDKYDSWSSEWTMHGSGGTGETKRRSLHSYDIMHATYLYDLYDLVYGK